MIRGVVVKLMKGVMSAVESTVFLWPVVDLQAPTVTWLGVKFYFPLVLNTGIFGGFEMVVVMVYRLLLCRSLLSLGS